MINKKGVFGLNAIQAFFAIILGVALLAYVIIIIMGTLSGTTILTQVAGNSGSNVQNESTTTAVSETGYALSANSYSNCQATLVRVTNRTTATVIALANYTTSGCTIYATGVDTNYNKTRVNVTYSYTYDSAYQDNTKSVLNNVSTGVSGFFSAINPVYAILAILVIVLVLIVLVRVVQAPNNSGYRGSEDSIL
jgi:uncharacterized membrane protein